MRRLRPTPGVAVNGCHDGAAGPAAARAGRSTDIARATGALTAHDDRDLAAGGYGYGCLLAAACPGVQSALVFVPPPAPVAFTVSLATVSGTVNVYVPGVVQLSVVLAPAAAGAITPTASAALSASSPLCLLLTAGTSRSSR
ncbi:MAG TPA: hypothetical protein VG405_10425 [Solirubrobacteraceae bacterium]|nr:hypothetical protein [Solirubrobacteraceae bacterium]